MLAAWLALTAMAAPTGAPVEAAPLPQLSPVTCPFNASDPDLRCATIEVPVDWRRPTGPKVGLIIAMRTPAGAGKSSHRLMFIDIGGPRGESADWVMGNVHQSEDDGPFHDYRDLSPSLRAQFTVVGVNSRERLVMCQSGIVSHDRPLLPATEQAFDAVVADNRRYAASCQSNTAPAGLAEHVDSLSNARDYNAIRRALKAAKMTFFGVSYGTVTGQALAQLFPRTIRAMVLDGVQDHGLSDDEYTDTAAAGAEDLLTGFARWCLAHTGPEPEQESCKPLADLLPAKSVDGMRAYFTTLRRAAEAGRLRGPDGTVSRDLLLDVFSVLASANDRPSEVAGVGRTLSSYTIADSAATAGTIAPAADPQADSQTALRCSDWPSGVSTYAELTRAWRRGNDRAPRMLAHEQHWRIKLNCHGWPITARNPPTKQAFEGVPILVVTMRHDKPTPALWAHSLAGRTGAPVLTLDGFGHFAYKTGNACIRSKTDAYLIHLTRVAHNTTCTGRTAIRSGY